MSATSFFRVLVAGIVCVLASAMPARGVVNGTPIPTWDRRFDGVGLFMRVSPSSPCAGWISGTCTLVGPNVVLIARHSLDITSGEPIWTPQQRQYRVRFRRMPSGLAENRFWGAIWYQCHGQYQELDVIAMTDAGIPGCDQVLAYLSTAPQGIAPIVAELNNPPLHPTDIILAGWGYQGECFGAGDHWQLNSARGRMPDNWTGSDFMAFSLCGVGTTAPCLSCPTLGGPYVAANLHDSGAPVFIEVPSTDRRDPTPELRLIATASSSNTGQRASAWNNFGGLPRLTQPSYVQHLLPGDFNGDSVMSVDDLMRFLEAFFAGRAEADTDHNGAIESRDVFTFVNAWFQT